MKTRKTLIAVALAATVLSAGAAETSAGAAQTGNSSEVYIGDRVATQQEIIDLLKPKPLTRGISLNPAEPAPEEQLPPPNVSMDIKFNFNSYQLTQYAAEQLHPLGLALASDELAGLQFLLEGHTDAVGSEQYNLELSQLRAESIKVFLYQNYGVDPSRLVTTGKGEYALLDPDNPASGINRRVTILTIAQ